MDTPTAAPDEKTPPPEEALATQIRKEKSLGLAGDQRRAIQLFRRPVDVQFDRRTSGVSFRTPKNARIPDVRGRQRATPNR